MCPEITNLPILSILLWLPLIGALILAVFPRVESSTETSVEANFIKLWSCGLTLLALLVSILICLKFDRLDSAFQFVDQRQWIPSIGVAYIIGIDGINLPFILLTTLVFFLTALFTGTKTIQEKGLGIKGFYLSLLALETSLLGGFLSLDLFMFYIFWELMLVPIFYLIGIFGGKRRSYASLKFVLYTLAGSVLMFASIIFLSIKYSYQTANAYGQGSLSFLYSDMLNVQLSFEQQVLLFLSFALAFAVKLPVFPFHTWLPDAYNEAPDSGTAVLSGVVSKIGLYGFIRFCFPFFPLAAQGLSNLLAVLAVIGIIYAALLACSQTGIKRLIGYSSVSHLGFCLLGVCCMKAGALNGAIFQAFSHGLVSAALFLLIGLIHENYKTYSTDQLSSLALKSPLISFLFFLALLGSVSLPLTSGFVGEFMILTESYRVFPLLTVISLAATVLSSVYMLSLFKEVFFKQLPQNEETAPVGAFSIWQFVSLAVLIGLTFIFGIKSSLLTDASIAAVTKTALVTDGMIENGRSNKNRRDNFMKDDSGKVNPSLISY